MDKRSSSYIATAILVVGLVNAWVLWHGLAAMNQTVTSKSFSSRFDSEQDQVTSLGNNRFAVFKKDSIYIYSIDAAGNVKRVNAVSTYGKDLNPLFPSP